MARKSWLDDDGQSTLIDNYASRLGPFVEAVADGEVDRNEVAKQEERVVQLMREIEPQLDDAMHARITSLLCELSAFNMMSVLSTLSEARPKRAFRG